MKPDCYQNNGEGILCVYKNPKWLVCIKNWKPDNDIAGIAHLEIHHSTDEQFILTAGKALLITAERENGSFRSIELTPMEQGKARVDFVPAAGEPAAIAFLISANSSLIASRLKGMLATVMESPRVSSIPMASFTIP